MRIADRGYGAPACDRSGHRRANMGAASSGAVLGRRVVDLGGRGLQRRQRRRCLCRRFGHGQGV